MSQSARKRSTVEMGHDAFLDIVANLVGILIILVVVLGAQSSAVVQQIESETMEDTAATPPATLGEPYASQSQLESLVASQIQADAAQADSDRLERLVKRYDNELDIRRQQRNKLLDLVSIAKQAWETKQTEVDQEKLLAAKRQTEQNRAAEKLRELSAERERLESIPEKVTIVEHLPTPMAKTVFGEEIHLRLKDNMLSIVPLDRLVNEIRGDLRRILSSSSSAGRRDGAVGPVRGYVARYLVDHQRGLVNQDGRTQLGTQVQLIGMTLEPLGEPFGEPLPTMMAKNGELDVELAGRNPETTTVTVWVYPESFAAFRKLQEHLYAKGFATAARPLLFDQKITASNQGTRSTAQ